jgi:hypothetical protein
MSQDPTPPSERSLPIVVQAALGRLGRDAQTALSVTQALGATASNQRIVLESTLERLNALAVQLRELASSQRRAREALERTQLVALNAGLESLRQADPAGRAFAVVAEELRAHVAGGLAAIADHGTQLDELDQQRAAMTSLLEQATTNAGRLADELLANQREQQGIVQHHGEIVEALGLRPNGDARLTEQLAEAAGHLDALGAVLSALAATQPGASVVHRHLATALRQLVSSLPDHEDSSR